MYSKILVAVDGSDTSLHALQQAIELAGNLSATIGIGPRSNLLTPNQENQ
jgi:nucleotide-binding universal stress UspA family protein